MKKKPPLPVPPKSEYEKLQDMFFMYSKILHPDFFAPFLKQLSAVYQENKREAYKAAKISDQALRIEKSFLEMMSHVDKDGIRSIFYIKCIFKTLLKELYDNRPA